MFSDIGISRAMFSYCYMPINVNVMDWRRQKKLQKSEKWSNLKCQNKTTNTNH